MANRLDRLTEKLSRLVDTVDKDELNSTYTHVVFQDDVWVHGTPEARRHLGMCYSQVVCIADVRRQPKCQLLMPTRFEIPDGWETEFEVPEEVCFLVYVVVGHSKLGDLSKALHIVTSDEFAHQCLLLRDEWSLRLCRAQPAHDKTSLLAAKIVEVEAPFEIPDDKKKNKIKRRATFYPEDITVVKSWLGRLATEI